MWEGNLEEEFNEGCTARSRRCEKHRAARPRCAGRGRTARTACYSSFMNYSRSINIKAAITVGIVR